MYYLFLKACKPISALVKFEQSNACFLTKKMRALIIELCIAYYLYTIFLYYLACMQLNCVRNIRIMLFWVTEIFKEAIHEVLSLL